MIASTVQLVEMFIKKVSPVLFHALGIYLPLITTNCAILALVLFQTTKGYGLVQSVVYALGAGTGFTLALVLMASLRERLELAALPDLTRGRRVRSGSTRRSAPRPGTRTAGAGSARPR